MENQVFSRGRSDEDEGRLHREVPWMAGAVLMLIGVVLLAGNLGGFELHNWWALFILMPAFNAFARAYQAFRSEGRFGPASTGPMVGGVILTLLACTFLFSLDLAMVWPVFLIVVGLGALVTALRG